MTRFNLDIFDTMTIFFYWYVKPLLMDESFIINTQFTLISIILSIVIIFVYIVNILITPILHLFSTIKVTSFLSIFMGLKFIFLMGLLMVIRGGIPRYRYDFLTKLGWIKTLSLALVIFLINILLSYL